MIQIQCGLCESEYEIEDKYAGGVTRCPACDVELDIPGAIEDENLLAELASAAPETQGWSNHAWDRGRSRSYRRRGKKKQSGGGLGVASLVIGIVSLLLIFLPFVGWAAIPLSILGLVLGIVATSTATSGDRGIAIAGLCVSAFAFLLILLLLLLAILGLFAIAIMSGATG